MKVLMINGSPVPKGCISTAFAIAAEEFAAAGVEAEEVVVGNKDVRGCIAVCAAASWANACLTTS